MARGSSSSKKNEANGELEPEIAARKRLKKLSFSNNLLSGTQAKPQACLRPSATVLKHNGKDIVKKSQRKNRFLFSFSGLLAPVSGGKIGELKDLGTKNPILYLEFPQLKSKDKHCNMPLLLDLQIAALDGVCEVRSNSSW